MKSTHFLVFPYLFSLISMLWATSAYSNNRFLQCLSLHSNDSSLISNFIYTKNNSSYSSVLEFSIQNFRFSTPSTPKPFVIVTPLNISHIQATIHCSRKLGFQIRTRSGGHDFEGLSYVSEVPFVVIDLINFRSINIDVKNQVAWVQSGATLGELYYRIAQKSKTLAFPGGVCHTVGIGGYISGGGYGLLFRKYGLAADNVIDAQLIDVNGTILCKEAMGEDLFWAIRGGGGGSFGIVLAWKLKLVPVPPTVTVISINKSSEQNAIELLHQWQYVAHKLPNEAFPFVSIRRLNSGQDAKEKVVAFFTIISLGSVDQVLPPIQEIFPDRIIPENCIEMNWIQSILYAGRIHNKPLEILLDRTYKSPLFTPSFKAKSDYVRETISKTGLRGLWSKLQEKEVETAEMANIVFVAYGGKMDEIPESATPFPHRAGNLYKIVYYVGWQKSEDKNKTQRYISWIRKVYNYTSSFVSKSPRQAYINYRDLDIGINNKGNNKTIYAQASVWGHKYFGINNFNKLMKVKTMIDPENFFQHEQSIPPI